MTRTYSGSLKERRERTHREKWTAVAKACLPPLCFAPLVANQVVLNKGKYFPHEHGQTPSNPPAPASSAGKPGSISGTDIAESVVVNSATGGLFGLAVPGLVEGFKEAWPDNAWPRTKPRYHGEGKYD